MREKLLISNNVPHFPLGVDLAARPDIRVFAERFLTRQPLDAGYDTHTLRDQTAIELGRSDTRAAVPGTTHLRQFIVKTVTDCNLRCVCPCYEYVDDSWRDLPPVMPDEIVAKTATRIGSYAAAAGLSSVELILHGGEPLYMQKPEVYYGRIIPLLLEKIHEEAPGTQVALSMQTNAILLRPAILDVLKEYNVRLGVSLDGHKLAHDAHRVTKRTGKGSHDLVMRGLARLSAPEYADLARSLLCVINVNADPYTVDTFLREHAPPGVKYIDYLLPYATHDNPPRMPTNPDRQSETPYADWLLPIFWRSLRQKGPQVRLFSSIMQLALGGSSSTEAIGPTTGADATIRADGSYETIDALKVAGRESVTTNMHVDTHAIEELAALLRRAGHLGQKPVAADCESCPVLDVCGGGHIATRFSQERLFDNPSAYCADLFKLTSEISQAGRFHTYSAMATLLSRRGVAPPPYTSSHDGCSTC